MRSKIYSLAFALVVSLAAFNVALAQNAEPAPPVAPIPPVAPNPEIGVYNLGSLQDTGFSNKMRKLKDQLRALNKQISDLTREQSRKVAALAHEQAALRFDADFGKNLSRTLSSITRFKDDDLNLQSQVANGDAKEKGKTFSKSYPVDASDRLQIDNRYGKVTVNTWAKNEIKVDVDIKAYSLTDEEAQKLLDETSVNATKDGNGISFSTSIQPDKGSWWGSVTNNGKLNKLRKVTINYTVNMPAKNALIINNRYGLVTLPSLDGKVTVNNTYGGLIAKELTNRDNNINIRYGDADIASVNGGDINVAYGSLTLAEADKLNAAISYSAVKIGRLKTSADINVRYGAGLAINDLSRQLKSLNISSNYAPVKLSSITDVDADFDVTVHYAPFLHNSGVKITSQTPDRERGPNNTKTYKGQIGKGNNDKTIVINSRYGGVRFD